MVSNNTPVDPSWPPGTVFLEDLSHSEADIVLLPTPSKDPNDPLNWPLWRKYLNFGLVSYYVVMVLALIDVATVTWNPMNEELGYSFAILNDSYAVGCGSLAIGAVTLVPFALKYGRRPIYLFSTIIQCAICVWSARMQTVADLMLVNILSCLVGALSEVMVQMTIADVFFVHQRGLLNTTYYWMTSFGISLSPLAGGYITDSMGWRCVWWWMVILFGVGIVGFFFLYEETMFILPPIEGVAVADEKVPEPSAKDIEAKGGVQPDDQPTFTTTIQIDESIPEKPYWKKLALWSNSPLPLSQLAKHSYRPFLILCSIPGVCFVALEYGLITACTTVPVTTLSSVMTMPPYNFGAAQIGLMGVPNFVGASLAAIISGPLSDSIILYLAKRNGGIFEPEMRLWLPLAFLPFVPAGLMMFGIGLNNGSHWLLPAFGLAVNAFGLVPASSAALTYLTDSYTDIIADSLVGVTFVRNVISTIFVFALQPWCDAVGLTWFYVTFGIIITLVMMGNLLFIYFGKRFRVMAAKKYWQFSEGQVHLRQF